MFKDVDVTDQLTKVRAKSRSEGNNLVPDALHILKQDLFTEKKILDNLVQYNYSFEFLDEEDLDPELIYTAAQIKETCILYRFKFLENKFFKSEIPYQAVLKVEALNKQFDRELNHFRILAPPESFAKKNIPAPALLFAKTNYDNYYLVHCWGNKLRWHRKLMYWPLRHFENLFVTIICITLVIALSLPTWLITLDRHAEYWSGYRAAAFFHLLIFNMGVTAYITFAFAKNFSSTVWNRDQDFG